MRSSPLPGPPPLRIQKTTLLVPSSFLTGPTGFRKKLLKETYDFGMGEQPGDTTYRITSVTVQALRVVHVMRQAFSFFGLPCRGLRTGNQPGARLPWQFPTFEQPARPIRIGRDDLGMTPHARVHRLNQHGIG